MSGKGDSKSKSTRGSKKTVVFHRLFFERWDPKTGTVRNPVVTLSQVKDAIEATTVEGGGEKLSSSNPANFVKDFIRRADSANSNWPDELKDLRWTMRQKTGDNDCFQFIPYDIDQTEPFEDPFLPGSTTPSHLMQSVTIPKASRDLGRKDEQWLIQVAVRQGVIPTHLALHSKIQIQEIVHLQTAVKLRKTEIDALFLAHYLAGEETKTALITCEAKHNESILPDQIVNQANAGSALNKADCVIPMAMRVVKNEGNKDSGGLVYVCEFESVPSGAEIDRSQLKLVSDCVYEFQPPIKGV
ncbi:MAG: hypothetical protein KDM63_19015 [Verrucomicrobiae bacterium]|nr:hypothetical protein [Verrucomicrobiae bacterium]